MSRETKIIALTGKGGVGKTSISAALVKLLVEEFPEKKILAIDADNEIQVAALQIQPVYFFICIFILNFPDFFNFSNDRVLIAFDPAWHKAGINDGIQILLHGTAGDLRIQVDILNGQRFHGVLVAIFRRLNQIIPVFSRHLCHLDLLLGLFDGKKDLPASGKSSQADGADLKGLSLFQYLLPVIQEVLYVEDQ